jgi:hypothetical protein
MKLLKSNKVQAVHGLMIGLNDVISRNMEQATVFADLTLYKGDIALFLKKQGGTDGPVVIVNVGREAGELRVSYFQYQSIINGDYDPFGLKKLTEKYISVEYHHKGFVPNEGFDYPKKMEELAQLIVHFFVTGMLPDDPQMDQQFPTLAKTIVMYDDVKR